MSGRQQECCDGLYELHAPWCLTRTTPERLIETSPGVYEPARYRIVHHADARPGDTVWVSERQPDGTWGAERPVVVVADTARDQL